MMTKEAVIRLKHAGLRNSQIAALLNVSKQYVSRVCRASQDGNKQAKWPGRDGFVSVGVAARLLGVTETMIRRWSDEGKIPSFRIEGRRRDRRFWLPDLWGLVMSNEAENAEQKGARRPREFVKTTSP